VYRASLPYCMIDSSIFGCANVVTLASSRARLRHLRYTTESYHVNHKSTTLAQLGSKSRYGYRLTSSLNQAYYCFVAGTEICQLAQPDCTTYKPRGLYRIDRAYKLRFVGTTKLTAGSIYRQPEIAARRMPPQDRYIKRPSSVVIALMTYHSPLIHL
jgi:hypothetical protein